MGDLLWFSGITWHTPLREIGWTYVAIAAGIGLVVYLASKIDRGGP